MDSSDSEGTERENPAEVLEDAKTVSLDVLPNKSRSRYEMAYKCFEQWYKEIKAEVINEDLILTYMLKISEKSKPTSLWSQYSMLKSTIMIYKNINIKYPKVIAYLKQQSIGYRPKKAKIFARSDIEKFLETANDHDYLLMKVVLIIGIAGACSREELCNLTLDNVDAENGLPLIKKTDSKTNIERTFAVLGEKNIKTFQKYIALRPAKTKHRRLFVVYKGSKCTIQPIGIQTIGKIPKKIAEFLELPNPEEYTGHSLRRSSAALSLNGGWKATKVAEGHIADSIQNKIEIANRMQTGTVIKQQKCVPGTSKSVNAIESDGRIEAGAVANEQEFASTRDSLHWVYESRKNFNLEEETEEYEEEEGQLPSFSEESVHDPPNKRIKLEFGEENFDPVLEPDENNENYGEPIIEENSNEPLKEFFNTMYLTTSKMPLIVQLKIKRAIFNTVLEAEETLIV